MLPPAKRLSTWRDIVGGSPMNLDFGEIERGTFACDFASLRLPDVMLVTLEGSPFTVSRDRVAATRGDDGINIALAKRGHLLSSSGTREVKNRPGEAMVWANDQPVETVFPTGGAHQQLTIPRKLLKPLVGDLDGQLMSSIPAESPALKLLSFYVQTMLDEGAAASPELRATSALHIQDLAALALGANRDAAEVAKGRGARAARLKALKVDIDARLTDHALSVDTVSLRHGISPRYVRALFEGEGTSFTEYVLNRRLLLAYRALSSAGSGHLKISAIAYESGFGDLSYFNQRFRQYFGMTPSDARALAK